MATGIFHESAALTNPAVHRLADPPPRSLLAHHAIRGNVEAELASDEDAGCGCAHPDYVGDDVVDRSNQIMTRLRATAGRPLSASSRRRRAGTRRPLDLGAPSNLYRLTVRASREVCSDG